MQGAEQGVHAYLKRACALLGNNAQPTEMQTIMIAVMLQHEELKLIMQQQDDGGVPPGGHANGGGAQRG